MTDKKETSTKTTREKTARRTPSIKLPHGAPQRGLKKNPNINEAVLFDHVTKTYPATPDKPALNDVSLAINQGEFVFLVGHSGSGKSTMIRSIIREIVPEEGKVIVGGYDLSDMKLSQVPYLRRNVGCVFQDFKLLPNQTAYENVAFAMRCIGTPSRKIREHVPQVLELVGLKDKMDKLPDELSGGEQQRVSIARAIVNQPPLLICDEPTGNLDPSISEGIMELLMAINSTGTTVIVTTHDKEIVNKMQQRVVRLDAGNIISDEERGNYV